LPIATSTGIVVGSSRRESYRSGKLTTAPRRATLTLMLGFRDEAGSR
jgi:hypothetical protein